MIDPRDVQYRSWPDGSETYTILPNEGEDGGLAIVTRRYPGTLHCCRCHVDADRACEHIIAAMRFRHDAKGAA